MKEYQSLSHTRWDCKYHVVFIPKRRKKKVFGVLRRQLGEIFRELAQHKESQVVEGHLMPDHVHMCISIPPKYAVSNVVGYMKGKSAITIARKFDGLLANAGRREHLAKARELLHVVESAEPQPPDALAGIVEPTFVCPDCGAAMIIIEIFARGQPIRAPPSARAAA